MLAEPVGAFSVGQFPLRGFQLVEEVRFSRRLLINRSRNPLYLTGQCSLALFKPESASAPAVVAAASSRSVIGFSFCSMPFPFFVGG